MRAQPQMLWAKARDSLWLLPGAMTLLAAALALALINVERQDWLVWDERSHWFLADGAEGARQVLSSIASGLITVTGVVFSVTIVALQLASSQFSPRVLRDFAADRVNQLVLGVLIGTFTYTVLVLGVVRSASDQEGAFVPRLAVSGGVVLVLVSIGFLIYFISHAAASMRVAVILDRVTRLTLEHVQLYFPDEIGEPEQGEAEAVARVEAEGTSIASSGAGYLQAVDPLTLFDLGRRHELLIRMECDVGQFVHRGQTVARVVASGPLDAEVAEAIRQAFVLGRERTAEQDVGFGLMEISDIAVKALSPAINDPTTAIHCIDRLTQILADLGRREPPRDLRTEDGRVHFVARHLHFERAVAVAFDMIRHFGAGNPGIVKKLLDSLALLSELLPKARHPPLIDQAVALLREASQVVEGSARQAQVERLAAEFGHLFGERPVNWADRE